MSRNVVIFGAKGRFGRAATQAFKNAGWHVRLLARDWTNENEDGVEHVMGNALNPEVLVRAAKDCNVIINALNPPYPKWATDLKPLTSNVLQAAKTTGATVMIPGNVYNFGENIPELLTENTAMAPTSKKGQLRCEMEQSFANAAAVGVRAIILRAGDFIEREKTGNWFDSHICSKIQKGSIMYPGPLDRVHAWAYLPDMARAMVELAEKRDQLAPFEQIGFPGFALSGRDLVDQIETIEGRKLRVTKMPWSLIKMLGIFMPQMREVVEMAYLWRIPHRIDASKFESILPGFEMTPVRIALAEALQRPNGT